MVDAEEFAQAFFQGSVEEVKKLTWELLERGEKAENIMNQGLVKAMDQVGIKFKNCEIYIPEVLIAARAMHGGLGILKPILSKSNASSVAKVVIGTVRGDLHDIGKNLVGMMLEGAGFEVVDLGIDVPPEKFIQGAKENGAKIIGMSALLTTTMMQMKTTVEKIRSDGLVIKAVVGGAPVTGEFAKQIGADGYAPDAASAVSKVKELLGMF
jgi:5-methyltetrahydrofolate--homocysteine methyltransferase